MKRILIILLILSAVLLSACGAVPAAPEESIIDAGKTTVPEATTPPEETPSVQPSPIVPDLEGEYELRGMSRDGIDESEDISQLRLLGMETSLSVNETNAGSLLFMNENSQVDFHVPAGTVTVTDPNGKTSEIEYRAYDEIIEFEWRGALLQFEKGEQTAAE